MVLVYTAEEVREIIAAALHAKTLHKQAREADAKARWTDAGARSVVSSSLENAAGEAADAAAALLRPDKLLQSYFADRWNILDATNYVMAIFVIVVELNARGEMVGAVAHHSYPVTTTSVFPYHSLHIRSARWRCSAPGASRARSSTGGRYLHHCTALLCQSLRKWCGLTGG